MKYLKISLKGDSSVKAQTLEALRTTTVNLPFVQDDALYLQLETEEDLISEIFSLGISFADLTTAGIDDPFDFQIVSRQTLPLEVAMAMN